ncbi:hypothetical protein Tco_0536258 [Tanacetum coccineum]
MVKSYKTRNSNKPIDQKSHIKKPGRQIFTGHKFSYNKSSAVYEKTSPRSDLRWKPTSKILDTVGLRYPNIHECKQTLDLSAGTSINVQKEQSFDLSAVVLKSSAVTTADAPDKHQQQPDSTSSTSTLATTVTADGNFDLSYALSWKPCQGDSLNLPDYRYKRRCCSPIPVKSDSLPHTHTQAFKVNHSVSRLLIQNFLKDL